MSRKSYELKPRIDYGFIASLIVFFGVILLLTGCGINPTVVEKPVEFQKPYLMVNTPDPVQQNAFTWVVITKDNVDEKLKELGSKGVIVVFAITPEGYQNLSMDIAELRRYIEQQNSVIAAYKAYYDADQKGK